MNRLEREKQFLSMVWVAVLTCALTILCLDTFVVPSIERQAVAKALPISCPTPVGSRTLADNSGDRFKCITVLPEEVLVTGPRMRPIYRTDKR